MIEKTKTGYYTSKITREMKIYAYEIIKQEEIKQKRYIDINKMLNSLQENEQNGVNSILCRYAFLNLVLELNLITKKEYLTNKEDLKEFFNKKNLPIKVNETEYTIKTSNSGYLKVLKAEKDFHYPKNIILCLLNTKRRQPKNFLNYYKLDKATFYGIVSQKEIIDYFKQYPNEKTFSKNVRDFSTESKVHNVLIPKEKNEQNIEKIEKGYRVFITEEMMKQAEEIAENNTRKYKSDKITHAEIKGESIQNTKKTNMKIGKLGELAFLELLKEKTSTPEDEIERMKADIEEVLSNEQWRDTPDFTICNKTFDIKTSMNSNNFKVDLKYIFFNKDKENKVEKTIYDFYVSAKANVSREEDNSIDFDKIDYIDIIGYAKEKDIKGEEIGDLTTYNRDNYMLFTKRIPHKELRDIDIILNSISEKYKRTLN